MEARKQLEAPFQVKNLDREGRELRVGDRVGFIMRGWFLPREQESFGIITEIDNRGGIKIDVIESYKRFTSSRSPLVHEKIVFFTHHLYDPVKRARVYAKQEGQYLLSIFRVDADEISWHMQEAEEAEARKAEDAKAEALAAARASALKGS